MQPTNATGCTRSRFVFEMEARQQNAIPGQFQLIPLLCGGTPILLCMLTLIAMLDALIWYRNAVTYLYKAVSHLGFGSLVLKLIIQAGSAPYN